MNRLYTIRWNLEQGIRKAINKEPMGCHGAGSGFCDGCKPGETFECSECKRLMPWCKGADDGGFDLCDDCWVEKHNAA